MSIVTNLLDIYATLDLEVMLNLREELLKIDREIVEDQLEDLGSQYLTYASLAEVAKKQYHLASDCLEIYLAEEKQEETSRLQNDGKRATAVALENHVMSTDKYKKLLREVRDTETKWGYLKGLLRAMEMRRDALVQICSLKKKEAGIYN